MPDRQASMARVGWAVGALLVSTAPHLPRMPAWVSLLTVACLAWRIAAAARGWNMIWRWLRMIVAGTVFFGVYVTYGTINGIEAGSALLVVMMDMKVLETARRRDFQVLMFIAYFLVLAQLLFEPAIWTLVYMGASVWVTTTALLQAVRSGPALPVASASRMVGKMMAVSLPVMLVLFLLFPRVPGPSGPCRRAGSASSGLDDQMSPGSINALSLSDEIAFRVAFEGPCRRPPALLAWPVFHQFDGVSWREAGRMPMLRAASNPGRPVRYRITLEPHDRPWLLALDFPEHGRHPRLHDVRLQARGAAARGSARRLRRGVLPGCGDRRELSDWVRSWSLQLPEGRNPLTVELGRQLGNSTVRAGRSSRRPCRASRAKGSSTRCDPAPSSAHTPSTNSCSIPAGVLRALRVGVHGPHARRRLPARVVTGYQGGQLNPIGGRFIVRQSDAHAWSEVWLDGEGWVRVDPTAAVAPDRIELGLADAVPAGEAAPGLILRRLRILEQIRQSWDAVDAAWDEWVLGYGPDQQAALLRSFGVGDPDWRWLAGAMAAMLAAVLAVLAAWLAWKYRPPRPDEVQLLYRRYLGILARSGLHRYPWEGPLDFSERAVAAFPAHAGAIRRITTSYVRVRYGPGEPQDELSVMRRLLKAFRPGRRPAGGT